MILNIFVFLAFSFIGWIIDSLYSSLEKRTWISSGYFRGLPFCPIYGVGGLIIVSTFVNLSDLSSSIIILTTTSLIVILEYVGGWLSYFILKERLWDYSHLKFNLHGYISLLNSFYWLLLISFLYFITNPYFDDFQDLSNMLNTYTKDFDGIVTVLFVLGYVWLTVKYKEIRLGK